jgi:long-chain fatty acid transport protein
LQYLSQGSLDFETAPEFTDLRPALEAGLGAAGLLDAPVDLSMELPQAVRLGGYCDLDERWALMGDVGWEQWSRFGKVGVAVTTDESNPPTSLTVDRNYEDAWHAAIGAQRRMSGAWTLLFGTAYDSTIVEDADRTPDLPLGASWRIGVGGERMLGQNSQLALAYEYTALGDLPMDVERGPLAGRVAGTYEGAGLHILSVSWRKMFPGS